MTSPGPREGQKAMGNDHLGPSGSEQDPIVLQIGDIRLTEDRAVTPDGSVDLTTSQWHLRDGSSKNEVRPMWAKVLAVLLFPLGLLFLLVKRVEHSGYLDVTLRSGTFEHLTRIHATAPEAIFVAYNVQKAQALSSQARTRSAPVG